MRSTTPTQARGPRLPGAASTFRSTSQQRRRRPATAHSGQRTRLPPTLRSGSPCWPVRQPLPRWQNGGPYQFGGQRMKPPNQAVLSARVAVQAMAAACTTHNHYGHWRPWSRYKLWATMGHMSVVAVWRLCWHVGGRAGRTPRPAMHRVGKSQRFCMLCMCLQTHS
jgi:hypothetical protein